jgi:hypothetical protein
MQVKASFLIFFEGDQTKNSSGGAAEGKTKKIRLGALSPSRRPLGVSILVLNCKVGQYPKKIPK